MPETSQKGTVTTGQEGGVTTYYYTMGEGETPSQAQAAQVQAIGGGSQAQSVVAQDYGQNAAPQQQERMTPQTAPVLGGPKTFLGLDVRSPSFERQLAGVIGGKAVSTIAGFSPFIQSSERISHTLRQAGNERGARIAELPSTAVKPALETIGNIGAQALVFPVTGFGEAVKSSKATPSERGSLLTDWGIFAIAGGIGTKPSVISAGSAVAQGTMFTPKVTITRVPSGETSIYQARDATYFTTPYKYQSTITTLGRPFTDTVATSKVGGVSTPVKGTEYFRARTTEVIEFPGGSTRTKGGSEAFIPPGAEIKASPTDIVKAPERTVSPTGFSTGLQSYSGDFRAVPKSEIISGSSISGRMYTVGAPKFRGLSEIPTQAESRTPARIITPQTPYRVASEPFSLRKPTVTEPSKAPTINRTPGIETRSRSGTVTVSRQQVIEIPEIKSQVVSVTETSQIYKPAYQTLKMYTPLPSILKTYTPAVSILKTYAPAYQVQKSYAIFPPIIKPQYKMLPPATKTKIVTEIMPKEPFRDIVTLPPNNPLMEVPVFNYGRTSQGAPVPLIFPGGSGYSGFGGKGKGVKNRLTDMATLSFRLNKRRK
jgi:hypothetical protein